MNAVIYCLFAHKPNRERLNELAGLVLDRGGAAFSVSENIELATAEDQMSLVPSPDLSVILYHDGQMEMLPKQYWRKTPLDEESLDGRLFQIRFSTPIWRGEHNYGPAINYAVTMLCLLMQADIRHVWYAGGGSHIALVDKAVAHHLIDGYIQYGSKPLDKEMSGEHE